MQREDSLEPNDVDETDHVGKTSDHESSGAYSK